MEKTPNVRFELATNGLTVFIIQQMTIMGKT